MNELDFFEVEAKLRHLTFINIHINFKNVFDDKTKGRKSTEAVNPYTEN
jgi:hypothetical protein